MLFLFTRNVNSNGVFCLTVRLAILQTASLSKGSFHALLLFQLLSPKLNKSDRSVLPRFRLYGSRMFLVSSVRLRREMCKACPTVKYEELNRSVVLRGLWLARSCSSGTDNKSPRLLCVFATGKVSQWLKRILGRGAAFSKNFTIYSLSVYVSVNYYYYYFPFQRGVFSPSSTSPLFFLEWVAPPSPFGVKKCHFWFMDSTRTAAECSSIKRLVEGWLHSLHIQVCLSLWTLLSELEVIKWHCYPDYMWAAWVKFLTMLTHKSAQTDLKNDVGRKVQFSKLFASLDRLFYPCHTEFCKEKAFMSRLTSKKTKFQQLFKCSFTKPLGDNFVLFRNVV